MKDVKDGGPAFPLTREALIQADYKMHPYGMSLRDFFAGQALQSIISNEVYFNANSGSPSWHEDTARICYEFADAMLKAREEK